MTAVASAAGLLSLLEEEDDSLKLFSLQQLNGVLHEHWFQIASSIAVIETLYEDEDFKHRETAALVASKVFYHLGELDDALTYALGAGNQLDITDSSEYVQTILARCIDRYIELQTKAAHGETIDADKRLVAIVERMFERCFEDGQYEQAIGIALESWRLDKLEEAIRRSPDCAAMLDYSLRACQKLVAHRRFREQVLWLLVKLYEGLPHPKWVVICECLTFLDDAKAVATILNNLLKGSEDDVLLAFQVGFDLIENEMQSFLLKVQALLDTMAPPAPNPVPPPVPEGTATADTMDADAPPAAAPAATEPPTAEQEAAVQYHERYGRLKRILSGEVPITLTMDFLFSHNHADLQVLKTIKSSIDARNSVCHSATIFANAMMHCGTSVDTFLRDNLDWLGRATNWAKFSATAGLGVTHKGNLKQSRTLMAPYLPRDNGSTASSPYSEGGALYALGLIHANQGADIRRFLLDALRSSSNEVIQHGACLGLGIAGLGTADEELMEEVKNVLYLDNAVAGEAAGMALGLIAVGTATDKSAELLAYAHDTQHEKIIRGLAIGLALIMYGQEEGAETLIEQMTRDQDPLLRYGGMYCIGLAYRGTGNNAAIQKLLHFAVSDVSDDVRRAAVTNLGFVLANAPQQCPRIVALLAESFNPHVRYGAAMAVGVSCAGTGLHEAQSVLEPLLKDSVDFVRQGALLALALVLMQQPESRLESFRAHLEKTLADKHEEVMCRMGAIMATGILDAGGRNGIVALRARSGYYRRTTIVGLAMFTQYWYWYPLSYFLSMSLQASAYVGVNASLQLPRYELRCECKPSQFAYRQAAPQAASAQVAKMPTAVLSTTARAKEKARKKDAIKAAKAGTESKPEAMDTGDNAAASGEEAAPAAPAAPEPTSYTLENPCRVVPAQERYVRRITSSRYVPLKNVPAGFVVLRDTTPGQPEELVSQGQQQQAAAEPAAAEVAADEPPPPEPFEYSPS